MRFPDRVVLVTGGGSGIGRAACLAFAREGARVAVVDRDADGAQETAAAIREETGADALVHVGDVGDPACAEATIAAVAARHGGLDVLMTAAGYSCGGTVLDTLPEDWDAVFRANVGGTWLFARAAIPAMRARGGGAIVTVASQLALGGGRGNAAYIAAKGAILSLTRTMALDHATDGIRVNALVPGAIETPMLARSFARRGAGAEAAREASRARHPLGRFGTAQEIAEGALYLAGATFVTGTTLAIDGGWLA